MDPLWLLEGPYEAKGWGPLEADTRAKKIDVIMFDRSSWALLRAPAPPTQYEGLVPGKPRDGLYLDTQGHPIYVAGGVEVDDARKVIATLGPEAGELLRKLGDPDLVLERLGRAY